ncbi:MULTISPECIES: non-homologous end-joining DNA ligase [Archaeoglobus]|jgi:DNA ligase D-like protein (predicted ligase)|uniref:DNA ligase, putative n=3 Tax=Archaeoglobus fulgidus TaxID=2234 RepID=O28549_ARCFU|nr:MULTISPECIES: non-homologous end-joining DNA ligase [Archaeoglobus]AAB89526.1 DNA ligase, putative [Archaeoglobus fulgidus DSM 4304]KUJ93540.1 MAG: DNA ligase, putative [Archaeoglobus fulgidus]KUK06349.1 MAG: DNA ligase, putative [Archaeoglobus fulgidus]MDI3497221.1 bifunctional non-ous end joining protein LigD [Archaeoglobus sp.]
MSWFDKKIKPMLAVRSKPFSSDDHIYEVKWDGTRCLAFVDVEGKRVRLQNRRLLDITYRYPEIKLLDAVERNAILDGEVVVIKDGKPSFPLLQKREHVDSRFKIEILSKTIPAVYIVFDVLYCDGWVVDLELMERKKILSEVLQSRGRVVVEEWIEGKGEEFYRKAVEMGLEGIVAKKKDGRYLIGKRSRLWKKIKKRNTLDCVIVGWIEGEGERAKTFGSLVLAVYEDGRLKHVGNVGTGFDSEFLNWFSERLREIEVAKPHFEIETKNVHWVKPRYVCEVEFLEFTEDGKLRAPVFLRLREDKSPDECRID